VFSSDLDTVLPGFGLDDLVALELQHVPHELATVVVVLNHEDQLIRHGVSIGLGGWLHRRPRPRVARPPGCGKTWLSPCSTLTACRRTPARCGWPSCPDCSSSSGRPGSSAPSTACPTPNPSPSCRFAY